MKRILSMIGVLVAIGGIIVPIAWDVFASRRQMEVQLLSSLSLVQEDPIMRDVDVRFRGHAIEGLTKFKFAILNSGRTPILEDEISSDPRVVFGRGSDVVNAFIVRRDPRDLELDLKARADTLEITFGLLNPTDYAELDVYVSGQPNQLPAITGRISGIKMLKLFNRIAERPEATRWAIPPLTLATLSTLAGLVLVAFGRRHLNAQSMIRYKLDRVPQLITDLRSPSDYLHFVSTNLYYADPDDIIRAIDLLRDWMKRPDNIDIRRDLNDHLSKVISRASTGTVMYRTGLAFAAIGIMYLMYTLLPFF